MDSPLALASRAGLTPRLGQGPPPPCLERGEHGNRPGLAIASGLAV
jgi:hypothetical protein